MWLYWDFFLNFQTLQQFQILASDLTPTRLLSSAWTSSYCGVWRGPSEESRLSAAPSFQSWYTSRVFFSCSMSLSNAFKYLLFLFYLKYIVSRKFSKTKLSLKLNFLWKSLVKFKPKAVPCVTSSELHGLCDLRAVLGMAHLQDSRETFPPVFPSSSCCFPLNAQCLETTSMSPGKWGIGQEAFYVKKT